MKLLWVPVYVTGIALTAAVSQDSDSIVAQGLLVLSTLMALLLFLSTFIMVAFHPDKQSFYDEWANCFVVRKDRVSWRQRLVLALLIFLIYLWLLAEYLPAAFRKSGRPGPGVESSVSVPGMSLGIPGLATGGTGQLAIPQIDGANGREDATRMQLEPGAGIGGSSVSMSARPGDQGSGGSGSAVFAGPQSSQGDLSEVAETTGGPVSSSVNPEAIRNRGSSIPHATSSEALTERPTPAHEKVRTPLKGLVGLLVVDGKIVPANRLAIYQKNQTIELGMLDEQDLEIATLTFSFDRFADRCGLDSLRFYTIKVSPERLGYSGDMLVEFARSMFSLGERDVRDIQCSFNSSGLFSVHIKGRGIIRRKNETILTIEWVIVPVKEGIAPELDRRNERVVPFSSIARVEEKGGK
jgi:hypothetical protein